jgi:hypothetical protein
MAALLLTACGDPRPLESGTSGGTDAGPLPGFLTTNTTVAQCAAANVGGVQLDTLTYSNFGEAFFTSWCTRCHATTVTGPNRRGAPSDRNFDTLAGVQQWAIQIDQVAAMNPTGSPRNDFMPAEPPFPPDDERKKLACFIATGVRP